MGTTQAFDSGHCLAWADKFVAWGDTAISQVPLPETFIRAIVWCFPCILKPAETYEDHARHPLRPASVGQVARLHHYGRPDTRLGHRREYRDLYAGSCGDAEVAAGRESRAALPHRRQRYLLRVRRDGPGRRRMGPRLIPALPVHPGQHATVRADHRLPVEPAQPECAAQRHGGFGRNFPWRIRLRKLLHHARHSALRGPHVHG